MLCGDGDRADAGTILAIQPTGEEVQLAQVITRPPPAQPEVAAVLLASRMLPDTASTLPMNGPFGLLTMAEAFAVRANGKRLK